MSCPVHDDNSGNNGISIYYFDPDYLNTGNGSLYLCLYASEDNYYTITFTDYLYLNGIHVYTRQGTVAPGQHNWELYTYSLKKTYDLVGYGSHIFNYGNDIQFTLNPARVFLFHSTANNDADEYDEFEMSNVTLSSEDGGYRTLTAKDGGIVNGLTISESSTNSSPKNSARFHKGAKAVNVTIGTGSLLTMENGSILQGNISVTGKLSGNGTVNAAGANITLNVKDHSPENEYMISGTSSLADVSSCTITVKADQEEGEYRLASGFDTSAVKGTAWENISFTIDGISLIEEYPGQYTFSWNAEEKSYNCIKYEDNIYSLCTPNTGESAGNLLLSIEEAEIPDQVLELLARKGEDYSVYENQKTGDILTVEYDNKKYYFVVSCVVEDATGFDAMGLIRVTSNDPQNFKSLGQSVVVCRGSETDKEKSDNGNDIYLDWKDDFNPAGVGVGQFNGTAAAQLKSWLATRTKDEVYFTGHSLGGALAQRFSVFYNSIDDSKIGGLVTFNAPGAADVCGVVRINADKVHHYVVDGDMISMVGDGFVTGDSASDSWYTVYTDNDVFWGRHDLVHLIMLSIDNASGYLLNRHTQTKTDRGKLSESGDISELADSNFSFLGTVDNFNTNYARFILSLATEYGDNKNDIICSSADIYRFLIDASVTVSSPSEIGAPSNIYDGYRYRCKYKECIADINTANSLTTREKAEAFRKTVDYDDFVEIILGNLPKSLDRAPDDYGVKADIILGDKDLISTDGSRKGHQIRTLEYGEDEDDLPDLLYDFTAAEFITIKHVALEDDIYEHDNNGNYVREVSVEKNENTWICFSLPFSYNNFLELKSIMTDSGQTVSPVNYIVTKNKIIVLDDPSTTYTFNFQRDESIIQTTAQIYVSETNISLITESIQLELSDIDASLNAGGNNDTVEVEVVSDSMSAPVRIKLTETAFEGVFTGAFTLKGKNGKASDITISCYDDLTISYNDAKNKDGNAEVITNTYTATPLIFDIHLDDKGLPEGYTGEFKNIDWVELQINTFPNSSVGEYVLIKEVGNSIPVVKLQDSFFDTSYVMEIDKSYHIDGRKYQLSLKDSNLVISVELSPRMITWDQFNKNNVYQVEISQDEFSTITSYTVDSNQLQVFNLPAGIYQYRVKTFEQVAWEVEGNVVVLANQDCNNWISAQDNIQDMFFAVSSDTWERGYFAEHHGILNDWTGTNERISLVGKNKISDIFSGSEDSNVLLLSDDANGDALFVDDIFTALPCELSEQQARLSQIEEIRAGAGDDIIDLTSQRFAYQCDNVAVFGGDGNDTIWANSGTNILFGDAGDDRLVGGNASDVLIGGAGNDSMHGGGGDDIFCFGGNWGNDTVEQLDGGTVILWFETGSYANWNTETLTYIDGNNSVKVSGVSKDDIAIVFADAIGADTFTTFKNIGAFKDAASEKIFEDKNSGMLA